MDAKSLGVINDLTDAAEMIMVALRAVAVLGTAENKTTKDYVRMSVLKLKPLQAAA